MPELKILGDSPTTEDGLGFGPYANILLEAINNFDAGSPLTIGIHGRWGSGKTSLMIMLKKGLKTITVLRRFGSMRGHMEEKNQSGWRCYSKCLSSFKRKNKQKKKLDI